MNTDCLTAIAEFAGPKQAMKISPFFVKKMFPSSILIRNYAQLTQFRKWAQLFDTSNLVEVRIVIKETAFYEQLILLGDRIQTEQVPPNPERPDGQWVDYPIGWVPASVKKLTIDDTVGVQFEIADTVEELVIENSYYGDSVTIPDSVQTLHLLAGFEGLVRRWSANLQCLTLKGWYQGGRHPVPIDTIPDTVKHMVVASHLNIEIRHWPESLETVEFKGDPDENWWSLEDAGIPDGVQVTVTVPPVNEDEPAFDYDDYEDPMVEMWYL